MRRHSAEPTGIRKFERQASVTSAAGSGSSHGFNTPKIDHLSADTGYNSTDSIKSRLTTKTRINTGNTVHYFYVKIRSEKG